MSTPAQNIQTTTDASAVPAGSDFANMSKTLEQILDVLRGSSIAEEGGETPESKFWATYKKVSNEYDKEFLERKNSDMDIILIFAGLFSAVNSAFIIAMRPNPADTTNALMLQMINIMANGSDVVNVSSLSPVTTYPSSDVWIQTLSYASLMFSLLAAFGAVLGKQWLTSYKAAHGQGSLEERGAQRQRRFDGLESWQLKAVLKTFLVLLQVSLFLFGLSLGASMWTQQTTISIVVICTTGLGVPLYVASIFVSIFFPHSPFQTAESVLIKLFWKLLRALLFTVLRMVLTMLAKILAILSPIWGLGCVLACYIPICALECIGRCVTACEWALGWLFRWTPSMPLFIRIYRKCVAVYHFISNPRTLTQSHTRSCKSYTRLTVDSFIQSSSIRWLLETSTDPDIVDIAVDMMRRVQWTKNHDVSAICARLLGTLTRTHISRQPALSEKYREVIADLCTKSVTIDKYVLLQGRDEAWRNKFYIHKAFNAGRVAWEELRLLEEDDNNRRKLQADVRTALRTMVVYGVQGMVSLPDDKEVIWDGDLRWHNNDERPPCDEFDWLIDYLAEKLDHPTDHETQGDASLALSAMHGLGSHAKRIAYIEALIRCMDSNRPSRVRYAALRAVFNAREELSDITVGLMPGGINAQLLDDLSSALLTAVGNHANIAQYPARDCCYLRLIFALTKVPEWRERLTRLGHVNRWTSLISVYKFESTRTVFPYIAGIYLQINPYGANSSGDNHPALRKTWGKVMRYAWCGLSNMEDADEGFRDCLEILPALVTATKQNWRGSMDVPDLPQYVDRLLKRRVDLHDDVRSAVQGLSDYLRRYPPALSEWFGTSIEDPYA